MKFYEKLSVLRKSHNYTQEQIADRLGVTRQTISKWEMGISEPSLDLLCKIADIYNCSIDELMDRNSVEHDAEDSPAENSRTEDVQNAKEPFWNIYKEAFFVLIVGTVLTAIYCVTHSYSSTGLSIVNIFAIECPIFIAGTVITVLGDERIKTKSGMLDLILPLLLVVVVQIIFGFMVEYY